MQYTRNTTMTKTDRDTLRSLHGRKKWEHIWAYYKLPIAIVLIVVYILGYAAYRHVTKKEDVLYLGLVNITAGSDLTEQLTSGFAEAQGLTKKQQVDLLSGLLLSESEHAEEQYVYASEMKLLYLIHQYYEIKAGHLPAVPLVSIFGAKAAPAYTIAKDIIHALLTLSKVIAADPEVSKWLQVVFVENYNVTAAEKLIPACDLSEQISLASKEASGTGNMKFMLNGALTLGTMDGANVEISQQVGEENIYIFGQTSDQVIHRYAVGDYDPAQWVEGDANIRRAISFLTGPEMLAAGHTENLTRLHDELIHKDWFQTLPDFNAYVVRKGQALSDYACDPMGWRRKCLVNIAKAGMFSSDRTIAEYDRDIWHLGK